MKSQEDSMDLEWLGDAPPPMHFYFVRMDADSEFDVAWVLPPTAAGSLYESGDGPFPVFFKNKDAEDFIRTMLREYPKLRFVIYEIGKKASQ